jgi:hypothetical protein
LQLLGLLLAACDEKQGDDEREEAVHGIYYHFLIQNTNIWFLARI